MNPIGLKLNGENVPIKAKARLVAQGFSQQYGIDFDKTYSPTVDPESIRLNNDLDETIYMHQPAGFEEENKEDHVWLLLKAIYGLKQSGRLWHLTLKRLFTDLGYTRSKVDPGVFFKHDTDTKKIAAVHIDDLTLVGNQDGAIATIKQELGAKFGLSDLIRLLDRLH